MGANMDKYSLKSIEVFNYYVYALIDPSNNATVYIGKGNGNRVFSHTSHSEILDDEIERIHRINDIEAKGYKVTRMIIKNGLSEE